MKAVEDGINVDRNGIGISNTISISNTIKIILSRKNRIENGTRALFLGSNPHSNGDVFSRSEKLRAARTQAAPRTRRQIAAAMEVESRSRVMDWEFSNYLLIKS